MIFVAIINIYLKFHDTTEKLTKYFVIDSNISSYLKMSYDWHFFKSHLQNVENGNRIDDFSLKINYHEYFLIIIIHFSQQWQRVSVIYLKTRKKIVNWNLEMYYFYKKYFHKKHTLSKPWSFSVHLCTVFPMVIYVILFTALNIKTGSKK